MPARISIAFVVLLVSACAAPSQVPSPIDPAYAEHLDFVQELARDADASAHQLALIDTARAQGGLTYADLSPALERFTQCLENAGLTYTLNPPSGDDEYPAVDMTIFDSPELGADASLLLLDSCDNQEFRFASMAYQVGPQYVEQQEAKREGDLPRLESCLKQLNLAVEQFETYANLERWVLEVHLDNEQALACLE